MIEAAKEAFQTFLEEIGDGAIEKLPNFLLYKQGESRKTALELVSSYLKGYCRQQRIRTTERGAAVIIKFVLELYEEQVLLMEELKKYINEMEVVVNE
ncbi:MAG: hypothetical protein ACLSFZ_00635 [Frisingicoccus sp.]